MALWGGEGSLLAGDPDPLFVARFLREAFADRLYALLPRHRRPEEMQMEERVRGRAHRYGIPTVAAVETLYHTRERRALQDVLTCIRHGVTLGTAGRLLRANDEHALQGPDECSAPFADDPVSPARTLEVAGRYPFSLSEIRYCYPEETLPDGKTSSEWLRRVTFGTDPCLPPTLRARDPGRG